MRKLIKCLFFLLPAYMVVLLAGCNPSNQGTSATITIGVINLSPQLEPVLDGFKAELTTLGYPENERAIYLYEGPAPDLTSLDTIARGLVEAEVDLILAISTPASQAAYRAPLEVSIPIIFGPVTDPIAAGLVTDLIKPGNNITGVRLGLESEEQRLQWLLKIDPNIHRIYVPHNSNDSSSMSSVNAATTAAKKLGVELVLIEARDPDQITFAIENIPEDVQAIFIPQDSLVAARIDDFAAAAIALKLPLCTPTDGQVEKGALLSYSFRLNELGKQQARLADQIFRGVFPGDLPVEIAEFFLTINLNTADQLGIIIPDEVLRASDKTIVMPQPE